MNIWLKLLIDNLSIVKRMSSLVLKINYNTIYHILGGGSYS